jgi:pimeloyl-ACP methyl ester carboxylesterase
LSVIALSVIAIRWDFEPFTALSDTRAVVTWDQLDCGRSDCPRDPALWTLERFVEELDIVRETLTPGPVHVLGHSWGLDADHGVAGDAHARRRRQRHVCESVSQHAALDRRHSRAAGPVIARGTSRDR